MMCYSLLAHQEKISRDAVRSAWPALNNRLLEKQSISQEANFVLPKYSHVFSPLQKDCSRKSTEQSGRQQIPQLLSGAIDSLNGRPPCSVGSDLKRFGEGKRLWQFHKPIKRKSLRRFPAIFSSDYWSASPKGGHFYWLLLYCLH